jgi:predicted acyltransferase
VLLRHVLTRGLLLVAIGFFLNLYPKFDFDSVRIPGVLQRIGLCYAISGVFMLMTAQSATGGLTFRAKPIAWAAGIVLVSYWALLYFVPVPGLGAPRFDPAGSWPSFVDRAVIGVDHFFPYWPVDGKVVFDPEGILSTWPSCFGVLFGALVGIAFTRGTLARPALSAVLIGAGMMGLALVLVPICPIIKNIWTSTFALFSTGFTLFVLGLLMPVTYRAGVRQLLWPARIFGENPLLAYILVFLMAPLIDLNGFGSDTAPLSLRNAGQQWFAQTLDPRLASLVFALACMAAIFALLVFCHRRHWILKL